MVNVLVVEDQSMPRQLFEMLVRQSPEYNLAYSIENAALADVYCMSGKVDLVLMDVCTAQGESGLDAAERIKKKFPKVKIVVVTSMPEFSFIRRAREIGVESFWYKDLCDEPILDVMDRTMAGEHVYPDRPPVVKLGLASSDEFTERELEILKELTTGDQDAEIAERLCISTWTVRSHVKHLLEKTGFSTRTRLAVAACESGLCVRGY